MNLYIDTTKHGNAIFVLDNGKEKNSKTFKVLPQQSDKILVMLNQFLNKSKIKNLQSKIRKIIIYKGQGSFTGLRVAAAMAQALSLAWGASVIVKTKPYEK